MLMGAHTRRVQPEICGHVARLVWSVVPPLAPPAPAFPAAEAVIDGIPAAKLRWHIAPGNTGPGHLEDRFDEHPVTEHGGATRWVLDQRQDRGHVFPGVVRQESSY
jgi:hypothetical protein